VLTALLASPAHAAGEVLVSLDYGAAPGLVACPGAADFRKAVARQLGYDPFRDDAPRRIVVRLDATGTRMGGRVEWRDANDQWEGERTFSSRHETCAEMARAMALATAIQIQLLAFKDEGALTAAKPLPEPEPPPPPRPAPPEAAGAAAIPVIERAPPVAPPAREPRIAVEMGAGLIRDAGQSPTFPVLRFALSLGRPSAIGVRLQVSGLGPEVQVTRMEGSARLDRLVMTLELIRYFRSSRRIQPLVAAGLGWQDLSVQGRSMMPAIAAAHEGQVFSAVAAASGGLAFVVATRIAVVVEVEALLFRPSVTVQVGSSSAASLNGGALFAHGGVLARF